MKIKFKNINIFKITLFSLLFLFSFNINKVLAEGLPFSFGNEIEIEVVTAFGSDKSNDAVGPELGKLKYNNIVRPGLCGLSCSSGQMNDQVTYYGINLANSQAYFGSDNNSFLGFYPNTASENFSIVTTVPNLSQGETSVFAKNLNSSVSSNYLDFEKLAEDPQGPSISFFNPKIGSAGQYVTIYGSGFYNSKGTSLVYFKNIQTSATTSANFSFPDICLQSIWSDNQVLIKVPEGLEDGDYKIGIKIRDWGEIESNDIFIASSSAPLLPSLCKISPFFGPINSSVSLWGEYFGDNSLAVFSRNKLTSLSSTTNDQADKISVTVPIDSVTGPVGVQREGESSIGNSLNFTVGTCSSSSNCPNNNFCCQAGTSLAGSCVFSSQDCLASTTLNSVFQWDFTTGFATSTTSGPSYSCASYSSCPTDAWVCPNSPGFCSSYAGGNDVQTGSCKNDCSDVCSEVDELGCFYQKDLNNSLFDRCIVGQNMDNAPTCSLTKTITYTLENVGTITKEATCQTFVINNEEKNYYAISVNTLCPDNWTMVSNGTCVDTSSVCSFCPKGTSCQNLNNNSNSLGVCVSNRLCSSSSSCQDDKCIKKDNASCQCCCNKSANTENGNPACCSPLICDNSCGSGGDYGLCSGCKISETASTSVRDQACNCSTASGKYCETDGYTNGACLDCTALQKDNCLKHSATCCWDNSSGVCHGGVSDSSVWGEGSSNIGYCPYYKCDDSDPTICASSEPVIDSTGNYSTTKECDKKCSENCLNLLTGADFNTCTSNGAGCCWDTSIIEGTNYSSQGTCIGGSRYGAGVYQGLCRMFECTSNNICSSTPFGDLETCNSQRCQVPILNPGASCRVASSTTNLCSTSLCSSPFNCLSSSTDTDRCGYCCCDPNAENDVCKGINSKLSCFANKGKCTGSSRGLCCGCLADADCGSRESTGCGSDTCCYSRPEITNISPADKANNVCRNSLISIDFDQRMSANTVEENILVLEENDSECSSNTYSLASLQNGDQIIDYNIELNKKNIWQKIKIALFDSVKYVAKIFGKEVIASPSASKVYCVVPGRLEIEQVSSDTSTINFYPNNLLQAGTKYFIIIKGDENLDSTTGIKNYRGIGMNGSGYAVTLGGTKFESDGTNEVKFNNIYFKNSEIFEFKTLSVNSSGSGICTIDEVKIIPDSYLFNNLENDINENDINPDNDSFNSARDEDNAFYARAYSEDGQSLIPTTQYNWTWDWSVNNNQKVEFKDISSWPASGNKRMIKVIEGVTSGEAIASTSIILDAGSYTMAGNGTYGLSDIYILDCDNPWPSIVDGFWAPWYDTSFTSSSTSYHSYNYKIYYCRDSGEEGTSDDLPAFSESNIINKGNSLNKVCTNNPTQPCDDNDDCLNGGFCLSSFLKETYFFRDASTITDTNNVFTLRYYTNDNNGSIYGSSLFQVVYYGNDGNEIIAVPNYGYSFDKWSDGNTNATRTDQNVSQNISVYPIFSRQKYKVMYNNGTPDYGDLIGDTRQAVMHGENGTEVRAVARPGYHFSNWTVNGVLDTTISSNTRTETDVTSNLDIKAKFSPDVYFTLQYLSGINGYLTVNNVSTTSNIQRVLQGRNGLSVTAIPKPDYHFDKWDDGNTSTTRADGSNLTSDKTYTANFDINTYTLNYTAGIGGTISGNANQTVNHGGSGTNVKAIPNSGYRFVSWTDGNTSATRTDLNITSDKSVTANFTRTYTLTYTAGTGGTLSGQTNQTVNSGGSGTTVTAIPNSGYRFVSWSDGVNSASRTDTNITSDKNINATFAPYTYTVTYAAGENGVLRQSGSTTPVSDYTQTVNYGGSTDLSFEAVPYSGYIFSEWDDGRTDNPRSDSNVTSNIDVKANFKKVYTLTYTAGTGGTISGNTNQIVDQGASGSMVTAVANTGYHFDKWSDGNTSTTRTDSNITSDKSFTASFKKNEYSLTYNLPSGDCLSSTFVGNRNQTVLYGENGSQVNIIPGQGCHFVKWSDNNSTSSARIDTNVTANINTTPIVEKNRYTLTYNAGLGGTVNGLSSQMTQTNIPYGGSGTAVTATPNTGFSFVRWSDGSTVNPRTDTNVTNDINVTAYFTQYYTLTYYVDGVGGTINGSTTQVIASGGSGTQVEAIPDSGYIFNRWNDGSINNPRTDSNVTSSQSYLAQFIVDNNYVFNCGTNVIYGGETYPTVQIGSQCWMAKNINIGRMVNGSDSGQSNNLIIEKFCYKNNILNCDTGGGLYQYDETVQYMSGINIQGICPIGWHIPSESELTKLKNEVGLNMGCNGKAATALASVSNWQSSTILCSPGNNPANNNVSGFNAKPVGYFDSSFISEKNYCKFWSSTISSATVSYAGVLRFDSNDFTVWYSGNGKNNGHSVRCLKN
ncbi:MAG TPA: FISUMP domain-containing protein [bacterium]|nr:FISUMP domain-containing protein [bacterium]